MEDVWVAEKWSTFQWREICYHSWCLFFPMAFWAYLWKLKKKKKKTVINKDMRLLTELPERLFYFQKADEKVQQKSYVSSKILTWIFVACVRKMHFNRSDRRLWRLWWGALFCHLPGVLQADIFGVVFISPSSYWTEWQRGWKVKDTVSDTVWSLMN